MNEKLQSSLVAVGVLVAVAFLGLFGFKAIKSGPSVIVVKSDGTVEQTLGLSEGSHFGQLTAEQFEATQSATIASATVTTGTFGSLNVTTATVGYSPSLLNVLSSSFNSASTTLCSVQNTSGSNRFINFNALSITGTSGDGANTPFRGYVSAGRVDSNTAATATLFTANNIRVVSGLSQVLGGPVPTSYYTSSTSLHTGVSGVNTSTLVLWPNGWYANVTSTAITSSTGSCVIGYVGL